jgi:N-acetylmuramoyl-L-alanine amidase
VVWQEKFHSEIPLNITLLKNSLRANSLRVLLLPALFLLFFSAAPREERPVNVPFMEIVKYFDLDYQLRSTTGIIKVIKDDRSLTLQLGSNEVYDGDGKIYHMKNRLSFTDAQILLPADGVDIVMEQLLKLYARWEYKDGVFTTLKGPAPVVKNEPKQIERQRAISGHVVRTVIIDAGHGGKDPGGIGYNETREKDIVLKVSKELERELKQRLHGVEVVTTREKDIFISLEERSKIANSTDPRNNPIYISIHANVSFAQNSSGYESYFLSLEPYNDEAREVASMENSVLGFEIENYDEYLKEIINRIVDIEYRRESMTLAELIQGGLQNNLKKESPNRGVKSAFFYVLKAVKMPSVLVEIGFVTNPEESSMLLTPEYQKKIAEGIADGIEDFTVMFSNTEGFTK